MKLSSRRGAAVVVVLVLTMATSLVASATTARTTTSTYAPWSSGAILRPSVVVAKTIIGSCWTDSIAVDATNAYRCTSGSYIYDPCFAPPGRHVTNVACAVSPWSDVVLLKLSAALPHLVKQPKNASLVWAEQLSNGVRCVINTGTGVTVAQTTLNYYCTPGDGWASFPDLTTSMWSASFARTVHAQTVKRVSVVAAWY